MGFLYHMYFIDKTLFLGGKSYSQCPSLVGVV